MKLPWDQWFVKNEEIEKVASMFILANCYHPQFASSVLQVSHKSGQMKRKKPRKTQGIENP